MFQAQNFDHLLGTPGFSDTLLKNHFTLYEGYVKNTNTLIERLKKLNEDGTTGPGEYAELKRRFGWEWNGVRLHELYFGNMKNGGVAFEKGETIDSIITNSFGSFAAWEKDFRATGAMRGIGWTVLTYDPISKQAFNVWVNEHDVGHLAGTTPLLIMDVFEHAFMIDYGLKRPDYIEAFMKSIDWKVVNERLSTVA